MMLIKLGGSLFAPKEKDFYLDTDFLSEFHRTISSIIPDFFLLHGTGNFGHGFVKKYGISKNTYQKGRKILNSLNSQIDEIFQDFERIKPRKLLKKSFFNEKRNLISGGDINPRTLEIISSDQLFIHLLSVLKPKTSIFLTDTDGIYDKNGNTIKNLNVSDIEKIHFRDKEGDVTGGMKNKLQEISEYLTPEQKVRITNGCDLKNLENIILNGKGKGTVISGEK